MSEQSPDIERLRAFDDAAWLSVERTYCGRMLAYVARRVRDAQAREDIVQETFLGAVRGIGDFDSAFTFEQYLFGICKNRTIDHLRRRRLTTLQSADDDAQPPAIERMAATDETPSRIVRREDLMQAGSEMLVSILRAWVQETWAEREFTRLMVIEALFAGSWRNKDTWQRFQLRDETSVAGIKFRALKRMHELALERDPSNKFLASLADDLADDPKHAFFDVGATWRAARASCPARHWFARLLSGTLEAQAAGYLRFHLDEMKCEWCQANHDDLARLEDTAAFEPLLERVGASTLALLRSRTTP